MKPQTGGKLSLGNLNDVPQENVRWPKFPELNARIRQITTAAQPTFIQNNIGSPNISTINQPQPVTILRVGTQIVNSTTKKIIVSFLQNSGDPNYQKVNVHLRSGKALPVLIGSGPTSPITITVARSTLVSTLMVQAEGNWGPHPLQNSPSKPVNLA